MATSNFDSIYISLYKKSRKIDRDIYLRDSKSQVENYLMINNNYFLSNRNLFKSIDYFGIGFYEKKVVVIHF